MSHGVHSLGRPQDASGIMRVASLCTGSAGDCLALDAVSVALQREGMELSFDVCMNCECVSEKREWINCVHKEWAIGNLFFYFTGDTKVLYSHECLQLVGIKKH